MCWKTILYFCVLLFCASPSIGGGLALIVGLGFNIILGNPLGHNAVSFSNYLLKASVIGLGFGVNINVLLAAGQNNIGTTTLFVLGVLVIGLILGKILQIERVTSTLIGVGTAICGGSAIAAVGSILKASPTQLSIATGTVFLLNAVALFLFPVLGHYFELTQVQFGTWCAIAIHDTSSVVGAAAKYGDEALQIASITKMLRILWIIPVSLLLVLGIKENRESFKVPLFIIGFLLVCFIHSLFSDFTKFYDIAYKLAKQGLVMSLFVIGSNLSLDSIKKIGRQVFLQAIILWILVCIISLVFIKFFV